MCLGSQEHHQIFKASACLINLDSLWPLFTFCVVFLFTFKILFPRNSKGYKTHANLTLNRARNLPPNQFMRFVADRALTNLSELRQIHHDMLFKDLHFLITPPLYSSLVVLVVLTLFLFDNLKIISVSGLISIRCVREYRKSMPLKGFIRQDRIQPGCHASKAITTLLERVNKLNLNWNFRQFDFVIFV